MVGSNSELLASALHALNDANAASAAREARFAELAAAQTAAANRQSAMLEQLTTGLQHLAQLSPPPPPPPYEPPTTAAAADAAASTATGGVAEVASILVPQQHIKTLVADAALPDVLAKLTDYAVKRFGQLAKQLRSMARNQARCDPWLTDLSKQPMVVPDDLPSELKKFLVPSKTLPLRGYESLKDPVQQIEDARDSGATALQPLLLAVALEHVRRMKVFYNVVITDRKTKLAALRSELEADTRKAYSETNAELLFDIPVEQRIMQVLRRYDEAIIRHQERDLLPAAFAKGVRDKNAQTLKDAERAVNEAEDVHTLAAAVTPIVADQVDKAVLQAVARVEDALQPFLPETDTLKINTPDDNARLAELQMDTSLSAEDLEQRAQQTRDLVINAPKRATKLKNAKVQAEKERMFDPTKPQTTVTGGAKGRKNEAGPGGAARTDQGTHSSNEKKQSNNRRNRKKKKKGHPQLL